MREVFLKMSSTSNGSLSCLNLPCHHRRPFNVCFHYKLFGNRSIKLSVFSHPLPLGDYGYHMVR